MSFKILKNIGFLLKQQIYLMLLASSLAFASEKAGVCQSSFNTPENSESRTASSAEKDLVAEQKVSSVVEAPKNLTKPPENSEVRPSNNKTENVSTEFVETDRASSAQQNLASFSVEENTNQTKPEAFPPLYRVSSNLWKVASQQDPITKKNLQEIFWNLVYESSNKNYSAGRFEDDLKVFIRNGVDIYAKDEKGWTALDHAVNNENHNLVTALTDVSERSVRGGYRSFMKSKFGTLSMTEGYSVSDYKRALRIAKKNRQIAMENRQEERVTHRFETGETIELSRFNLNEKEQVNEEIIDTLKWYLSYERKTRFFQSALLGFVGGITLFVTGLFL